MFAWHFFESNFFNRELPLLRRKESAFAIADLPGLVRIHWTLGDTTLFSTFYTRIDQACLLWGLLSGIIFVTAQFSPLDWGIQAILWSTLTGVGTIATVTLSPYWTKVEPLNRVFSAWVVLMLAGTGLTDLSVFLGWSRVLVQVCPLWLGITTIGYLYTGLEMRSRAFLLMSLVPLLGMALVPFLGCWQFSATGFLIGVSMLLLAEFQWDSSGVCANHAPSPEP